MATIQLAGTRDEWTLGADEQDEGQASLGDWLRRAREARGLTLDGITQETRIPRRHLEAIEHGDLSVLPEFYHRAEVRAFARVVGVDEQLALARLQPMVAQVPPRTDGRRPQPARRFSTVYAAVVLVAAAITVAALIGRPPSGTASMNAAAPAARETQPSPAGLTSPASSAGDARNVALPAAASSDPAPAAAPPSAVTELVVTTQPSGARVTVNGIGWGSSPVAIKYLPPGDKRIRVSKDGYGTAERVLVLDEGRRRSVDIPLPTAP